MQVGVARTDVSVDRQRIDGPAHVNGHTMANGLARTGCVKVGVKEFGLTRLIPGAFTDRYDSGQLTYGDFGRKFDATGFGVDINVGSVLDTARCGVVSPEVAAAMAEHVRAAFGTDLALSITGLAGPGGDGVHTVGTLFVALATPDGTFHRTLHKDKWGRVRIKHAAANHAFDMVRRYLTGLPVEFEENR